MIIEDFESAVWRACDDLFISTEEAQEAIDKYRLEISEQQVDA